MLTNLAFKLGGRHLYTSLGAGYQPGSEAPAGSLTISRDTARWCSTVGIGWRFGLTAGRLEALEVEASGSSVYHAWSATSTPAMVDALRVTGLVRLAPHVSLLAGVAAVLADHDIPRDADLALGPQSVIHDGHTTIRMYPGFVAGVQL
jgi:hypothetical protein